MNTKVYVLSVPELSRPPDPPENVYVYVCLYICMYIFGGVRGARAPPGSANFPEHLIRTLWSVGRSAGRLAVSRPTNFGHLFGLEKPMHLTPLGRLKILSFWGSNLMCFDSYFSSNYVGVTISTYPIFDMDLHQQSII